MTICVIAVFTALAAAASVDFALSFSHETLPALTWDISEKCPATILRRSDNAILYLEPTSAAKL